MYFGHSNLSFDLAQYGELVEPFGVSLFEFRISRHFKMGQLVQITGYVILPLRGTEFMRRGTSLSFPIHLFSRHPTILSLMSSLENPSETPLFAAFYSRPGFLCSIE